ncbi:hypothetical protein GCM10010978_19450 [Compostibacillus humi]|uniref:UDP-2,4-diacetamido-2,4, 6-trideoxy-beta-L-altropyranose hydrolase n=1 Tax=Compostibacillus humi TaxID=1245525 RepID=A0A8J2TSJ7_9BACI|nr:UDP-2,4-diacetamido-2,4,6-trideoxy-beta-L-altropyranose hydrolase [Compostibacillus humi]GFZ77938.1 hypothetical protein GCM10010978_19450 [Compostibacillus humi]
MNVCIRTDASIEIGSGHVMRCLTLADELQKENHNIFFICRELKGDLIDFIKAKGYSVYKLVNSYSGNVPFITKHSHWLTVPWSQDAEQSIAVLRNKKVDWLVVDHYAIDYHWERKIRPYVQRMLVIDDLADRRHECDLLLDANYFPHTDERYKDLVPGNCRTLLGPGYALLRDEFKQHTPQFRRELKRILVFMGGSDPDNETLKVIQGFQLLKNNAIEMDVVVGKLNKNRDLIKKMCHQSPNIYFHYDIQNISELMARADLAFGAGGSTTWERCSLGLPACVITIAENQKNITKHLAAIGAVIDLGEAKKITSSKIAKTIGYFIKNPRELTKMSRKCLDLVDVSGVRKVVKIMNFRKITIVTDKDSWINQYIPVLINGLNKKHEVLWVHNMREIEEGDIVFILSYSKILTPDILKKNKHNLVVHESALPKGRGWSPLTWQILEGKNEVPIVLFEAEEKVDSGAIYLEDKLIFDGTELIDEIREQQARKSIELCLKFVSNYDEVITSRRIPIGTPTYYRRRTPEDSELNIYKSIAEQFNLLRVADNEKYPAFFVIHGKKYYLRIEEAK